MYLKPYTLPLNSGFKCGCAFVLFLFKPISVADLLGTFFLKKRPLRKDGWTKLCEDFATFNADLLAWIFRFQDPKK